MKKAERVFLKAQQAARAERPSLEALERPELEKIMHELRKEPSMGLAGTVGLCRQLNKEQLIDLILSNKYNLWSLGKAAQDA